MSESYEQFEQVVEWVAAWAKRQPHSLSPTSYINHGFGGNLGVDGDDAIELFEFLSAKSGVRFYDFPFDSFFGPELGIAALIIHPLEFIRGLKKKRLTIRDVAQYMFERKPPPREKLY